MTFRQWAHAQRKRQDAVGDVCRALLADPDAPTVRRSGRATRRYLEHRVDWTMEARVLAAFDEAIAEWQSAAGRA